MSFGERLQEARARKKWAQDRLAEEMGVSRAAVSQWESGTSRPKRKRLDQLAAVLGVTVGWLDRGELSSGVGLMPVKGEVAAGVWREVHDLDLDPIPVAPHPGFPALAQYGLLVRGTSLNRFALDSEYLHVVDVVRGAVSPRNGDLVVVQKLRHGAAEATAKRYIIGKDGPRLEAVSDDPRFQGAIPLEPVDPETEIVITAIVIGKYAAISRGPM